MTEPCEFVWYELLTPDADAAKAFYAKVVGWSVVDPGMDTGYALWTAGETQVGGLMGLTDDMKAMATPPAWRGFISAPDVDDYAKRVTAAGGAVHFGPTDIPGVGRFAAVSDSAGAGFLLFKGDGQRPAPAPYGAPGHIGWRELMAGDGAAAMAFYGQLFGWREIETHDMGPMGLYRLFGVGDVAMGGMMTKPAEAPGPVCWQYYFNVDDIDAAAERVKAAGGQVLRGPMPVPSGVWVLHANDPQGVFFALSGPKV